MPVKTSKDSKGCFAQWGDQKKYYYDCGDNNARDNAKQKAHIQGATIMKQMGIKEEGFIPPESGTAPKKAKEILDATYSSCRTDWVKKNPNDKENDNNKTYCSRVAWSAVKKAGYAKDKDGIWIKKESEVEDSIEGSSIKNFIEGVSTKSWASVDKAKLPKSAFLWIEGDGKLKSQWHLPYKDEDGNVNLNALRAIASAIGGARSGEPMKVPSEVISKFNSLLKKYKIGDSENDEEACKGKSKNKKESEVINLIESTNIFEGFNGHNIDEENKVIKNVCVMGNPKSKNGYTYAPSAIQSLAQKTEGTPVYANHPSKSEMKDRDGIRDINHWVGVLYNSRLEGQKVYADLKARPICWELVKDIATMGPIGFGNSINSRVKVAKDIKTGQESIIDIDKLKSVDLVTQAATTTNLFESEKEDMENIYKELNLNEGVLADEIKKREIEQKKWRLISIADDAVSNCMSCREKSPQEKKDEITSILDDLDRELKGLIDESPVDSDEEMPKDNGSIDEIDSIIKKELESLKKEFNTKEENMDLSTITLEQIKTERPDLVSMIESFVKEEETVAKLESEKEDMSKELKDVKESFDKISIELNTLKEEKTKIAEELDKYKLAEIKMAKESFIELQVKESELPKEAISDFFKNDLMSKDEEAIKLAINDRKEAWFKGTEKKVVKNSGWEHLLDKKESSKDVQKDTVEAFIKSFKR